MFSLAAVRPGLDWTWQVGGNEMKKEKKRSSYHNVVIPVLGPSSTHIITQCCREEE